MRSLVLLSALALGAAPLRAQTASVDTTSAHRDSVAAVLTPATGTYNCVRTVWAGHPGGSFRFDAQGLLTLGADGTYTFERSNMKGTYTVEPVTRHIQWNGGYFADKGALDATFGTDGAPHVEVRFHERSGETRWVCAQSAGRQPAGSTSPAGASGTTGTARP